MSALSGDSNQNDCESSWIQPSSKGLIQLAAEKSEVFWGRISKVLGNPFYTWLAALVVIVGLTVYLMRGWLFGGGVPTSARREVITELTIVWMAKQDLLRGQLLTEWNHYWFSGFPWLRYLSYPTYYAVAAVSAWGGIPLETAMVGFFFLALACSALAMFGYLNRLLGDWRPALIGALIYEAFPYHNHVGVETWIHAAFWAFLPLALWLVELSRADGKRHLHYQLLGGAVLGLFPVVSSEYALLTVPFVVLYVAFREWDDIRNGRRTWRQAIAGFLAMGLTALGTSCFFVLPAVLEVSYVGIHAKHGSGTTFTNQLLSDYSVTPRLVAYAIARRWHLPADGQGLPGILGSFWSVAWYPGIIVSLLCVLGLLSVRRHFAARLSLIGLLLALLMITGPTSGLNFFAHLPVLGRLSPFRGMLLVVFFASTLSAFGMAWLLRYTDRRRLGGKMSFSALLLAGAMLLVVADFGPSAGAYQTTPTYFSPEEQEAYAWLKDNARDTGQARLWEVSVWPRDDYLRTYSLSQVSMPRFSGYYDNGAPLYTWQQGAWTDLATRLHLHQVRYVLIRDSDPDMDALREQLRSFGYQVVFRATGVQIWENPKTDDYARFHETVALDVTRDFHNPFKALPEFVWRDIAMVTPASYYLDDPNTGPLNDYAYLLVDSPAAREPGNLDGLLQEVQERVLTSDRVWQLPPAIPGESSISLDQWQDGQIRLLVRAERQGVLVLSESWYPHWRVWVDDKPQQVLRADWALLGVWVEPGEHQVKFSFQRPWYVLLGFIVSGLTWLVLAQWWISGAIANFKQLSRLTM